LFPTFLHTFASDFGPPIRVREWVLEFASGHRLEPLSSEPLPANMICRFSMTAISASSTGSHQEEAACAIGATADG
jgi:hypothetical protein